MLQNYIVAAAIGLLLFITGVQASALAAITLPLIGLDMILLVRAGLATSRGLPSGFRVVRHLALVVAFCAATSAVSGLAFVQCYLTVRLAMTIIGIVVFAIQRNRMNAKT